MSQTFTDDPYEQSYAVDTTMTNMENNDLALKSMFSGSAAPSNLVAFMPWGDTTKCLKRRNIGNTAWLAILSGDASQKMYVYRNDTCEGWVIDATVTDRVLAVKGGSDAYNVNGGLTAGTWTQPGHVLTEAELPSHTHSLTTDGDHSHTLTTNDGYNVNGSGWGDNDISPAAKTTSTDGDHTHTVGNTGSGSSHNHGSTYRPAAAVGTLQYPDL